LVVALLERGLVAPAPAQPGEGPAASAAPSVRLGAPMALAADQLSNAALSELLDG
jgi:hypothetical protein